jgi:hypothetical protein
MADGEGAVSESPSVKGVTVSAIPRLRQHGRETQAAIKVETAVNLKTTTAFGPIISPPLLSTADEVVDNNGWCRVVALLVRSRRAVGWYGGSAAIEE